MSLWLKRSRRERRGIYWTEERNRFWSSFGCNLPFRRNDYYPFTYEIESVEGDVHRDITYTADGSLISIEESLPFADLPEPVRNAIRKQYPKATVSIYEKLIKGSTTQFEVLVTSGKQKHELVLNGDGTIAKKEKK